MGNAWRPTACQQDAIRRALRVLNSRQQVPAWVCPAELQQAAMVALWQTPGQSQEPSHLFQFCRSRMLDELRRIIGRGANTYAPLGDVRIADQADHDTPELIAIAHQEVSARLAAAARPKLTAAQRSETQRANAKVRWAGHRPKAMTAAERKARERSRKIAAGLRPVREIYAHPEDHAAVRQYAELLKSKRTSTQV